MQFSIDNLFPAAQAELGGRWGRARGYAGRAGGVIYNADGRFICQGWYKFARLFRARISEAYDAGEIKLPPRFAPKVRP